MDSLKHQRDRFVAFAFAAADLLIEVGADNRIAFAAGASQRLLGFPAVAMLGRGVLDLFPVAEHGLLTSVLVNEVGQGRFGPISVQVNRKGQPPGPALLGGCKLPGRPDVLYLTMSHATVTRAAEALAMRRDTTTGLLAAEDFAKATAEHIKIAQAVGQEVKLTLIDMSGIEQMREQAGADPTFAFLQEVGSLLRSRSVGNATARLADDKYGLLHDASVDAESLQRRIQEMAQEAAPAAALQIGSRTVSADHDMDEAEMARALIYTMNSFVSAGSSKFSISTMAGAVKCMMDETLSRVTSFKTIVANREMQLHFQPIVDLKRRQPHHYEVLVRFDGDKSPYELIKFAESMHLVHEMDLAICEAVIDYIENVAADKKMRLAVNLSAQSLQNETFATRLMELLGRHPHLARQLIFEITESTELHDLASANKVIQVLRDLGHEMCLDDFGAGFASFQYLHGLHVDYVKLDGRYIRAVLDSPRDRVMLRAMVGLCTELGIRTVGEMIETENQASILDEIGVEFGQGWLFGKPGPVPQAPAPTVPAKAIAGARRR